MKITRYGSSDSQLGCSRTVIVQIGAFGLGIDIGRGVYGTRDSRFIAIRMWWG